MKYVHCIIVFLLILCSNVFGFSTSVVVQMSQHDEAKDALRESTYILENGVLDVLFEAGFIVSSLPTSFNLDTDSNLKETIKIAKEGFMRYVVYIDVYYRSYDFSGDETITVEDIEEIDWKIVSTSDMKVLSEGNITEFDKLTGENDFLALERFSTDLGTNIFRDFDKNL